MHTSGPAKKGKRRGIVLIELEESIFSAKDLSELGNAVFRVGCERMDGNLTLGEWERLRKLGAAKRMGLIKKLPMEERNEE